MVYSLSILKVQNGHSVNKVFNTPKLQAKVTQVALSGLSQQH